MDKILYGAAYYDEYMPYDRLDKDVELMKRAGINTVRIAESTWSTCEPQPGVFDFSHVVRVMDAMEAAGIYVIIGTPTYAVPTWLAKAYPEVLAVTGGGRNSYGGRQNMDITNPTYLYYAERVIRELMKVTAHRRCVIGYQVDNETKYYGTAGNNVQQQFIKYLREKFNDNLDALNSEFGLDYWSNRINSWEDFPDVRGTINGSLGSEFDKFRRSLVAKFLCWQADIVSEYKRDDQFITHNFDFDWRGHSFGIQQDVDHHLSAEAVTVAGVDIYHPSQDELTGAELAFGGDITRSLKRDNYFVLETQAQGFPDWTPYKGQLRLCAYAHLSSGADCVEYWHWHSIHNSFETYWKGLLSHDFAENDTYNEACIVGNEFKRIGDELIHLKKNNRVAIMVSNEALTALKWFPIRTTMDGAGNVYYNDVFRWIYDALYRMNIECDILWTDSDKLSDYAVIFLPALYAVSDVTLEKLKKYTADGGVLVSTFKTAFANENVKVHCDSQPHILSEVFGISYNQFSYPKSVGLSGELFDEAHTTGEALSFMELVKPQGAQVLAGYVHYNWQGYSAITQNCYGKGKAVYIGCMTDVTTLQYLIRHIMGVAEIDCPEYNFPIIIKNGVNQYGKRICYIFNFSGEERCIKNWQFDGVDLLSGKEVWLGDEIALGAWNLCVIWDRGQTPCPKVGTRGLTPVP